MSDTHAVSGPSGSGTPDTVRKVESPITLNTNQITTGVTLSGTPTKPAETTLRVAGGGVQVYGKDYTVAANKLTFSAAMQSALAVNDEIQVEWI